MATMDIINAITNNKPFLKWLYNYRLDRSELPHVDEEVLKIFKNFYFSLDDYDPDINGYTLFFLVPPHLSSPEFTKLVGTPSSVQRFYTYLNAAVPFLATSVTPPTIQVKIGEYNLRTGGIPMAEEVEKTNDLTVQYIDTKYLHVYSLHSIWIEYIDEVSKGIIKPGNYISKSSPVKDQLGTDSDYIADGNIDYATCAYILRFSPDFKLTYFARATGIFPNSISPSDIVGNRANPELTIVNVSYTCAFYHEFTYPELEGAGVSISNPGDNLFLRDFSRKLHMFLQYT